MSKNSTASFTGLKWGLVAGAAVALLFLGGLLEGWELESLDWRFGMRCRLSSSDGGADVVVVAVDERSLAELGQWPWPRSLHAELLRRVSEAGAVGFDIIFNEPSPSPDEDLVLAGAAGSGKVVFPVVYEGSLLRGSAGRIFTGRLAGPQEPFQGIPVGHITVVPDPDGVLRRVPIRLEGVPVLALRLVEIMGEGVTPPLDPWGNILVNYRLSTQDNPCPVLSYIDVLKGQAPAGVFKDKAVLVGVTARGAAHDMHLTPVAGLGSVPGVLVQAQLTASLLNRDFLWRAEKPVSLLLLMIIALGSGAWFFQLPPARALLAWLISLLFLALASLRVFLRSSLWMELAPMLIVLSLNLAGSIYHAYRWAEGEKRRLREVFSRYLPPQVLEGVLSSLGDTPLGGRRVDATVLFADLRGFTSMSEFMPPEEVVSILNQYLGAMSAEVAKRGGALDKFTGDGVMAIFGAPMEQPDHPIRAVETAMAIRQGVALLPGAPGLRGVGIGVASGEVLAGHIGSWWRMDYTVIGDAVNLAARLEKMAEPGQILLGDSTAQAVRGQIPLCSLSPVRLPGKRDLVRVWTVCDEEHTTKEQPVGMI